MFAELRLRIGENWTGYRVIQNFRALTFDEQYNSIGSISFEMPKDDADAMGISDQSVVEVAPNGVSYDNLWYGVEATSTSRAVDGTVWTQVTGVSLAKWIGDAIVYPSTWPHVPRKNPDGTWATTIQGHAFWEESPGFILGKLLAERAKERGGLKWLDTSNIHSVRDSNGTEWNLFLTITYNNGESCYQIIQDMADRRLIDFSMSGRTLNVYNFNSRPTTYQPQQRCFFRGRDILEEQSQTDSSKSAGTVLMQGQFFAITEHTNNTIEKSVGRRKEMYAAQENILDLPSLKTLAQATVDSLGHIMNQETVGVTDTTYVPWQDYKAGDWVWVNLDGTPQQVQILQIAASQQDSNNYTLGLTLGDRITFNDEKLARRIANMTGGDGSVIYGAVARARDKHYVNPMAPTDVRMKWGWDRDAAGHDHVNVFVTWTPTPLHTDNSPLIDLSHYDVQWNLAGNGYDHTLKVPANNDQKQCTIHRLPTGKHLKVRVRAVDGEGNMSEWSDAGSIDLGKADDKRTRPSKPKLKRVTGKAIKITWDGKDASGVDYTDYDPAFSFIRIHLDTTANFTPTTDNSVGTLHHAGSKTVTGLTPGQQYWAKFVVVDKSINASDASDASDPVSPELIQVDDVGFSVDTSNLVSTYTSDTPPDPPGNVGSLWIDSSRGYLVNRWDGTQWVALPWGDGALGTFSISHIETSSLNAAVISIVDGGALNIGTPVVGGGVGATGIQINANGIIATADGAATFSIDGTTGTVQMTGTTTVVNKITGSSFSTGLPGDLSYIEIINTSNAAQSSGSGTGSPSFSTSKNRIQFWSSGYDYNGLDQQPAYIAVDDTNPSEAIGVLMIHAGWSPAAGQSKSDVPHIEVGGIFNPLTIYGGNNSPTYYAAQSHLFAAGNFVRSNTSQPGFGTAVEIRGNLTVSGVITGESSDGNFVQMPVVVHGGLSVDGDLTHTGGKLTTGQYVRVNNNAPARLITNDNGNHGFGWDSSSGGFATAWVGGSKVAQCGNQGNWNSTVSFGSLKKDIETTVFSTDFLDAIRPVTFEYRDEPVPGTRHHGILIEELEQHPEARFFLDHDESGEPTAVNYTQLAFAVGMAVNKKLDKKVAELEARIAALGE